MSLRMRDAYSELRGELRYEPTARRVRAFVDDVAIVDTTSAMPVWEPRRIIPSYAVPAAAIDAQLVPVAASAGDLPAGLLHPGIAFAKHSTPGRAFDLVLASGRVLVGAAFIATDDDLAGLVILNFDAFDNWREEDELLVAHPRDPFHRVDVLPSSRHVRIEFEGVLLAESARPMLVFETGLPMRSYLPIADVAIELVPSDKATSCAYKGAASYLTPVVDGEPLTDLVWSYVSPLSAARPLAGLVAFLDERVDVWIDGVLRDEQLTPLAASIMDEAGL